MPKPSAISVFVAATSLLVVSAPVVHAQSAGGLKEWNTDQDVSEEKLKEYKDTSSRWIEMGPEVASIEIQNWRQKRRFEEALSIFETLKPDEKAPIIAFMYNSDDDSLIELADALSMRDRGLLPSRSDEFGVDLQN